jgi:hypothetical protein
MMFVKIDELYINPDQIKYIQYDYREDWDKEGNEQTRWYGIILYFDTVDGFEKPHAEQGNSLRLSPEKAQRFLDWLERKADIYAA